jgi:polyphosphate kinase 2
MIIYNRTEYKALSQQKYSKEKNRLQVELLKLQEWVINRDKRVAIVLEGRDAAGKGSTIKRFIENMMPKGVEVIELGVPTKKQEKNWFRTWEKRMPESGKIHFFDRSWYSRALIQPVMGYCNEKQYKYFMSKINKWEKKVIEDGLILIKMYLSISKENQEIRFHLRETSALKYWKISPNDWKAQKKWQILTTFKEVMFNKTSTRESPWVIINSDNKMIGRLNAMRYVLSSIEYEEKENLKQKVVFKFK